MDRTIQPTQRAIYNDIIDRLQSLETFNGRIKPTVRNLSVIAAIKNRLARLVLNDEYIKDVKDFAKSFNEITKLQNEYWRGLEKTFKPRPLLKAIQKQSVGDTVKALAGAGIGESIGTQIGDILNTNITTGGSYAALTEQLRQNLMNTETPGILDKYIKTIAVDSISTYARQYSDTVSSDLGFEWYSYRGSEIKSSRELCQALVENHRYFHRSSIPNILKGQDENGNKLKFRDNKDGKEKTVRINPRNGLPYGLKDGTNESNFLVLAGGWNCPHIPGAVSEKLVKTQDPELYNMIVNAPPYKKWKKLTQI